jgi:hypothetical protein
VGDVTGYGAAPPPPPPPEPPGGGALPSRGIGDILSAAFQIYTKNAGQLILIVAIVVVPLSLISFLLTDVVFNGTTEDVGGIEVTTRTFAVFLGATLAALAISIIISAILQAALLRGAAQGTIGDPVDINTSYRWGLSRFGSVLLVSILVGLSVAIGFILLIIPGIFLLVMLAVSVPAVVVENKRGTDAMRRSWDLVKGHFWHVLGVIVVAALLTGLVSGLISAIGGSNRFVGLITGMIAQILVAPYSALVSILLYLDLRARGEMLSANQLRGELAANT